MFWGVKMFKDTEYRMFQILLVLMLLLQLSNAAVAAAPAEKWNRSFGGNGEDISRCVQQTSDGGYVIAGTTIPYGEGMEGYHDAWLIKVDNNGNLQWNKTFERTYSGLGYFTDKHQMAVMCCQILHFLLIMHFLLVIPGSWLIKIDKNGNVIWKKGYDKITHEDYLQYRAERTSDGGYIIGDTAWHEIGGYEGLLLIDNDIRLTKYDINGKQQWNSTFGQKNSSEILDPLLGPVKQAPDGGV